MWKIGACALGVFIALSANVLLPGAAAADTDPALAGDCAKTLGADSGAALTLDAGAPVNQPGVLTIGTGSHAANNPLLHLDLADVTHGLRVQNLPGAPTLAQVCTDAQGAVNALSATTRKLLGAVPPVVPAPPVGPPKPPKPPAEPAEPAPARVAPTDLGTAEAVSYPLNATAPSPTSSLETVIPPLAVPPHAPSAVPPTGTKPGQVPPDAGSAQALPASSTGPAKLPLLLSAIALAIAAAALAHTWLRRRLG